MPPAATKPKAAKSTNPNKKPTSKPKSAERGRPRLPADTVRKSATLRMSDTERELFQKCADAVTMDLTTWMRWTLVKSAKDQQSQTNGKGTKPK